MFQVKKKLQAIKDAENEGEGDENEEEEEEEGSQEDVLEEPSVKSEESEVIAVEPLVSDKSAQFNYFQERKKALLDKKPKNITDDLTVFLKTMIMTDDHMREIMKEKELLEFKRKQLDFMTMGMLLNKPNKRKKSKKGKKGKSAKKSKGKQEEISKDLMYNVRPNEFMLMLQVVMNSLEVMEYHNKQEEECQSSSVTSASAVSTEGSTSSRSSGSSSTSGEGDEEEEDEEDEEEEDDDEDDDD